MGHNDRSHRSRPNRRNSDFEPFNFGFVFRTPDEVFREFFGIDCPFNDLYGEC